MSETRSTIGWDVRVRGSVVAILFPIACGSGLTAASENEGPEPKTDATAPAVLPTPAIAIKELRTTERLAGDMFGLRPDLDVAGIGFGLGLSTIYQQNAHGGENTHNAHRITGSYDLEIDFDFEAMGLWSGGTAYVLGEGAWGPGISDLGYVGDAFGVNGDAGEDRPIRLSEFWYEHTFLDRKVRVRAGRIDLTNDFDTNDFANDETTQFLNNGLINAANIPFPDVGFGLQVIAGIDGVADLGHRRGGRPGR